MAPVTTDVAVDKDLQNRVNDMEKVRQEVIKIQAAADGLKGITKPEDIDTKSKQLMDQYKNEQDSLISSAMSYYNMLAEKQKLDLKLKQYDTQIPALATKLEADLNDLVKRISDLRKTNA